MIAKALVRKVFTRKNYSVNELRGQVNEGLKALDNFFESECNKIHAGGVKRTIHALNIVPEVVELMKNEN